MMKKNRWLKFLCWAKEWYIEWLIVFIVIFLIIRVVFIPFVEKDLNSQNLIERSEAQNFIYYWLLVLGGSILFLYNIIITKTSGVIFYDDSIVTKTTKYKNLGKKENLLSIPYNDKTEIDYKDIENIIIDKVNNLKCNITLNLKDNTKITINNLKKWEILKSELIKRWIKVIWNKMPNI